MNEQSVRYCGRDFTPTELQTIRALIDRRDEHPTRAAIARAVCEALSWRKPDGQGKAMSARVALLRMHRDGLIRLPPPTCGNGNGRRTPPLTARSDPRPPITGARAELTALHLQQVTDRDDSRLWNELIQRYHYLGYQPLPGAQLRYLIRNDADLLGALGLSAAAWKVAPRDRFIGWTPSQREAQLHRLVNNSRFLLLPWVQVRYLASSVLSLMTRQLGRDWQARYNYQPLLLETFVERARFNGTCYRAANWIHVGHTQGRGKLDHHKRYPQPIKDIYLYPLRPNFRQELGVN